VTIRHVPPEEVADHWPRVREELKRLDRFAPEWEAEDMYHLLRVGIKNGGAQLSVNDDGFMIWQRYPGDDGRGMLFIIAMAGKRYQETRADVYAEVQTLAKQMGCRVVRMISPRKGWSRDPFWNMTGYVYEHAVERTKT
jgi:hypothetical protein